MTATTEPPRRGRKPEERAQMTGWELRALRESQAITSQELAAAMGSNDAYLCGVETGKIELTNRYLRRALAGVRQVLSDRSSRLMHYSSWFESEPES
jgi:transcriptional regulator with XRE-family HTH domain